jgi:hypothetical protein
MRAVIRTAAVDGIDRSYSFSHRANRSAAEVQYPLRAHHPLSPNYHVPLESAPCYISIDLLPLGTFWQDRHAAVSEPAVSESVCQSP